jgi:bifunctional non-homologous end joining protein LigD
MRPDIEPRECQARPAEEWEQAPPAALPARDEPSAITSSAKPKDFVQVSNREKIFWPDEGYTKGDLVDYYDAISDLMLPFLEERPIVLVRYPDGITGKNFYQWRAPAGTPDWMRTLELRSDEKLEEKGEKRAFLVDNAEGLVHIANLGCIPIHVLASRAESPGHCDFLTIDLDIGEQPFRDAVTLALSLREILDGLGLEGFPKTSGQKGLHVLIPMGPGVDFDSAKLLVELLGRLMVAKHSKIATMERRVQKRGPKVYVDTGQTGRARTIVAPYSVRAAPGATVSTPLLWDEVHAALDPSRFTMFNVPARAAKLGDPMARLLEATPDIASAVQAIGKKLAPV